MYCDLWPYVLWPLDYQIQKRIVFAETIWGNTVRKWSTYVTFCSGKYTLRSLQCLWLATEGRAFFSPRVRLNCSCQVVGHNRSSSLRYDQDFFVPIFYSHRYFMLTFLSGLSFDVCLYIPAHSNRVALQSKSCVNPKTKCTPSVIFTIVPKVKCFLKSIRQVIYKTHCRYGVRNSSIKTLVIWNLAYTLE